MQDYKAPQRDTLFVTQELLDYQAHYQTLGFDEVAEDLVTAIFSEAAKFAENSLAPINASGDEEGCKWDDGVVTTPAGFKEAYQQYMEGGWQGMTSPVDYGGQGLPQSLGLIKSELIGTANWVWGMYPGLSQGAMNTI